MGWGVLWWGEVVEVVVASLLCTEIFLLNLDLQKNASTVLYFGSILFF